MFDLLNGVTFFVATAIRCDDGKAVVGCLGAGTEIKEETSGRYFIFFHHLKKTIK